jgi:hypothetical protein
MRHWSPLWLQSIQSGNSSRPPKDAPASSIRKPKREADEKPKTAAAPGEEKKLRVKWKPGRCL